MRVLGQGLLGPASDDPAAQPNLSVDNVPVDLGYEAGRLPDVGLLADGGEAD